MEQMTNSLVKEIQLRTDGNKPILETIYFGGGTPSLLSEEQIEKILFTIQQCFQINHDAEITIECNPDDLSKEKLNFLKQANFNRLSIGIQSFDDDCLTRMNRIHNASDSLNAIENAIQCGFNNITIDLIYGIPGVSHEQLKRDIQLATSFNISHISAYCLTVEEGTALNHFIAKGKYPSSDDNHSMQQFEIMVEELLKQGFEQYEISNFARNGAYSKHNTSYWKGKPYIGIGPSAHSFDLQSRSWNIPDNQQYMKLLEKGIIPSEKEMLHAKDIFNEHIMTGLRTKWGCNIHFLKENFPEFYSMIENELMKKVEAGLIEISDNKFILTAKGKFLADGIASDLFVI